jgi:hypothetical protein
MIRIAGLVFITLILGQVPVWPQAAPEPLVHKVDFPKGNVRWTVTFEIIDAELAKAAEVQSKKDPQQKKIEIVRTGDLRHDVIAWSNNSNSELWWVQNPPLVFQDDPDGKVSAREFGNMKADRFDESNFEWIGAATFKGIQDFKDRKCRYYEKEITLDNDEKAVLKAWIDAETLKPYAWTDGARAAIYTFSATVPGELVLPEKYQSAVKRLQSFFGPPNP